MEILPLTAHEREATAQRIAAEIKRRGTSPTEARTPSAWDRHAAAVALQVHLIEEIAAGTEAAYFPEGEGDAPLPEPLIVLAARSDHRKSRQAAHELAHHLQRVWVAPHLYGAETVYCRSGQDNRRVRHTTARRVEEILSDGES